MWEILQYEFMRNALIAGVLTSIACGIIGTYVIINRIVFISGGIAHTAYGGIGLGYYFHFNPLWGAIIFSLLAALGMGIVKRHSTQRADTIIGVMWAIGMAIGIILIDLTSGYASDLMSYLFGSILAVPNSDLLLMLLLNIIIIGIVIAFYKEFLALSFDEEYSLISGIWVDALYLLLLSLIALTVVMLMRVVGLILLIALLTIPAAIAEQFTANLKKMMILASILGIFFTIGGLLLSYYLNITSGATIILLAGTVFLLVMVYKNRWIEAKAK